MRTIIGIILILAGLALGLWLGVWVLFIGGTIDIINQIRTPELNAAVNTIVVAWGIVKIIFAFAVVAAAIILVVPGWAMAMLD